MSLFIFYIKIASSSSFVSSYFKSVHLKMQLSFQLHDLALLYIYPRRVFLADSQTEL